ncbi:DUF7638 domain-containing protein [Streptodolium elevatio]|uniref:DUF7638 domain-containing protein n=1 Tax=Streptodolium elevatio TaxID=3157996 RepID=A0ABV3DAL6_9ACTN
MHPTHRMVDGSRVEGLSRPALHRFNGRLELVNLAAYADGIVSVGGGPWATWSFERFVEAVHDGEIVAHVEDGMQVHAYDFGDWTVAEATMSYDDPTALITEMADAVDRLNGRPDTVDRFYAAVRAYGRESSPEALAAMRTAADAVPDRWGWLVDSASTQAAYRVMWHDEGATLWGGQQIFADEAEQARQELAEYAAEWDDRDEAASAAKTAQLATASTVELYDVNFAHPDGPPPRDPGALRNEFPLETSVAGATYPSLHHAFHALSILDDAGREAVAAEPMGIRVPYVAAGYPERPEWPAVRPPS